MSHKKRVLAVDDEPINLWLLEEFLTEDKYSVDLAKDGQSAWEKLTDKRNDYYAVILDRMMPNMDGIEVLRMMQKDDRLKTVPVILQTAKTKKKEILEGLEAGAHYYLTKPYTKEVLLAIVKTAVDDHIRYESLRFKINETNDSFAMMDKAFYSFRTLEEANCLATAMALTCPNPESVVLGIAELAINAIEHGNLGITYEDKTTLNELNTWSEEVRRRLALPENREKRATLEFSRIGKSVRFVIKDEGEGFDPGEFLQVKPERAFDNHGRGIAISKAIIFDRLEYRGKGNEVVAVIK